MKIHAGDNEIDFLMESVKKAATAARQAFERHEEAAREEGRARQRSWCSG